MYVVEGGQLRIYDTTTDKIYTLVTIDILGNAVDVKLADFEAGFMSGFRLFQDSVSCLAPLIF